MVEFPLVVLSAFAVFISALVQGTTGFGFVIVAAPVLAIYLDPHLVVPVMVFQGIVLNMVLMVDSYRHLRIRRVWLLMVVGAACTPVGTFLLVNLHASSIRMVLGAAVVLVAIAMLSGVRARMMNERAGSVLIGAMSGVLTGVAGIAGAPVVLFFTNRGVEPREFRANIVFYLQVVSVAALPSFFLGGVLTGDAIRLAAALLPASLAGIAGGIWLSRRVSTGMFRRLALIVVLFAGFGAIWSGVIR